MLLRNNSVLEKTKFSCRMSKKSFCPVKSMLGEILRKFGTDLDFDKNLKLFAFLKKIIKI